MLYFSKHPLQLQSLKQSAREAIAFSGYVNSPPQISMKRNGGAALNAEQLASFGNVSRDSTSMSGWAGTPANQGAASAYSSVFKMPAVAGSNSASQENWNPAQSSSRRNSVYVKECVESKAVT